MLTPVTRKRRKEQALGKEAEKATKRRKVEKTYAHQIRWSGLQNGDGILGVVKEIQEMDIKISLPNMKTGYCSIREGNLHFFYAKAFRVCFNQIF